MDPVSPEVCVINMHVSINPMLNFVLHVSTSGRLVYLHSFQLSLVRNTFVWLFRRHLNAPLGLNP